MARRGLPLFEYGLVDAATVRAQRMGPACKDAPCPVPLALLEEYERFVAEFRKETVRCTLDNELDLGMWVCVAWLLLVIVMVYVVLPTHPQTQRTCRVARCLRPAASWAPCVNLDTHFHE